jgi:hypothetical protein
MGGSCAESPTKRAGVESGGGDSFRVNFRAESGYLVRFFL